MNIPIPQHGGRVGAAVQSLINTLFTLLATLLGWQLDSVENIAGLATVDDTRIPDGSKKVVRSLWDSFTLDKTDTTSVVDGITVVATMSGDGRWLRDLHPTSTIWSNQATWYVDADNGNDENDGSTDATELATFAEFRRRVEPYGLGVETTVTIESDLPADDPVGFDGGGEALEIVGVPTVDYNGTVNTFTKASASNNPGTLNDAGWAVGDHLHKHVLFTSGAADGMGCWILEADFGGAGNARVTTVVENTYNYPSSALPAPGDTFEVHTLPACYFDGRIGYYGSSLSFRNIHHVSISSQIAQIENCEAVVYAVRGVFQATSMNANDCMGFIWSRGYFGLRGGAFGTIASRWGGAFASMELDVTVDGDIPGVSFSGGVQTSQGSSVTSFGDVYLFGDFPAGYGVRLFQSARFYLSGKLRGQLASARLMRLYEEAKFYCEEDPSLHTVTEKTIRLDSYTADIELDLDTPLFEPHFDNFVGNGSSSGAVSSKNVGIKGALTTPGTVFALEDLTENATEVPILVTNRSFLRNLQVNLVTGPGAGINTVVHVYLNGVDQGAGGAGTFADVTLTGAGANVSGSNTSDSILVVPGDRVSIYVENDALSSAADLSVSWEMG